MCVTDRATIMTRLIAILVTLFLVAIPAKADVALWPRPVPGWTVIQVYGVIKQDDLATFVALHGKRRSGRNPGYCHRPGRQPRGWYQHGSTRSLEEADRRCNGQCARRHVPLYG